MDTSRQARKRKLVIIYSKTNVEELLATIFFWGQSECDFRMNATIACPDGKPRCNWSGAAPEFFAYHDTEWGFPVGDDHRLFEKLSLEGFQSGLSWRTILAKREN